MADTDQTTGTQLATAGGGTVMIEAPQNPYLEGIARLSIPRQVGVIVGLAATVALAVWLVLWTREADMRPLYGSMENLDSQAVIGVLESNQIKYRIDANSGMLLVEDGRYSEARLKLAEAGMPNDSSVGFEMLDKEQGIGTSQFMETARFRRGLEGELARTISSITSVRSARVHLAIPERSVFVRDQRKPSASVLLEVVAGRTVEDSQVRAIGNLVASSVPDMELAGVTIVDQKGRLLSNFAEDREAVLASKQLDFTRSLEDQMVERVRRILEPVVGAGRFKAEVTADVDFTAVEQADEIYNPDLPAIRSEQRSEEQRLAGEAGGGIPGAACLSTHWPGTFEDNNNPIPGVLLQYIKTHLPKPADHKFYFDHGTLTLDSLYKRHQEAVDAVFLGAGYSILNYSSKEFVGDDHTERSWARRLYIPAMFLLSGN